MNCFIDFPVCYFTTFTDHWMNFMSLRPYNILCSFRRVQAPSVVNTFWQAVHFILVTRWGMMNNVSNGGCIIFPVRPHSPHWDYILLFNTFYFLGRYLHENKCICHFWALQIIKSLLSFLILRLSLSWKRYLSIWEICTVETKWLVLLVKIKYYFLSRIRLLSILPTF